MRVLSRSLRLLDRALEGLAVHDEDLAVVLLGQPLLVRLAFGAFFFDPWVEGERRPDADLLLGLLGWRWLRLLTEHG
jgi:hypothetical protein